MIKSIALFTKTYLNLDPLIGSVKGAPFVTMYGIGIVIITDLVLSVLRLLREDIREVVDSMELVKP